MNLKMYSIKDLIADEFGPIQLLKNDAVATRMFKNIMLQEAKNNINPEDFRLYCVGEFNNATGEVSPTLSVVALDFNEENA